MINLSLNELKLIAKSRNIKDYKNKKKLLFFFTGYRNDKFIIK